MKGRASVGGGMGMGWGSSGIVPMSKLVIGLNWYAIDYPLSKKPTEVNARISFCEAANLAASLPAGAVACAHSSFWPKMMARYRSHARCTPS